MADGGTRTNKLKPQKAVCHIEYDKDGKLKTVVDTPIALRNCQKEFKKMGWKQTNFHFKIVTHDGTSQTSPNDIYRAYATFVDADSDSMTYILKKVGTIYTLSEAYVPQKGSMIIMIIPMMEYATITGGKERVLNPNDIRLEGSHSPFVLPKYINKDDFIRFNVTQVTKEESVVASSQKEAVEKASSKAGYKISGELKVNIKVVEVGGGGGKEGENANENQSSEGSKIERQYKVTIRTRELIIKQGS